MSDDVFVITFGRLLFNIALPKIRSRINLETKSAQLSRDVEKKGKEDSIAQLKYHTRLKSAKKRQERGGEAPWKVLIVPV